MKDLLPLYEQIDRSITRFMAKYGVHFVMKYRVRRSCVQPNDQGGH